MKLDIDNFAGMVYTHCMSEKKKEVCTNRWCGIKNSAYIGAVGFGFASVIAFKVAYLNGVNLDMNTKTAIALGGAALGGALGAGGRLAINKFQDYFGKPKTNNTQETQKEV